MPPDPNCCRLAASCLMIRPTEQNPTPYKIMHPWPPGFGGLVSRFSKSLDSAEAAGSLLAPVSYPELCCCCCCCCCCTTTTAGLTCCRNLNPSSNQESDMGASVYHSKRPRSFARICVIQSPMLFPLRLSPSALVGLDVRHMAS